MKSTQALGSSTSNQWQVNEVMVDFIRPAMATRPVEVPARPQHVRFDLERCALVIIDMQNDFCHEDGWLASIGVDVSPCRNLVPSIEHMLEAAARERIPKVWVNWGNRPDLLNLGPSTLHTYNPTGAGTGLGDPLANGARVLQAGSWASAIIDEFGDTSRDIHVSKFSMSGFWETHLDAILRNLGVTTLLFAGVNLDQCVLCTLQDASFRGYDCILLADCCASTSPEFCSQAALYNVQQCFGFVAQSAHVIEALARKAHKDETASC